MDIDWQMVARAAVGAVPAIVALVGLGRGAGALRSKILGAIMAVGFGFATIWLFNQDHVLVRACAAVTVLLAAIGLYGIFESAQRVPRDAKGHRL